jgi:hypothetical protein
MTTTTTVLELPIPDIGVGSPADTDNYDTLMQTAEDNIIAAFAPAGTPTNPSATEVGYLAGVTSAIPDQLDALDTGKVDVVMSAVGDLMYGGASGAETRLAGNITTTTKVLTQTGDGANSAAPTWEEPTGGVGGCLITAYQTSCNPTDGETYYFGANFNGNPDNNGDGRFGVPIPLTGTVTKVFVTTRAAVSGDNNASSLYFRYDNTSDTLITNALAYDVTTRQVFSITPSIAVTTGHYFEIKWVCPTWASTNPTGIWFLVQVWVEA